MRRSLVVAVMLALGVSVQAQAATPDIAVRLMRIEAIKISTELSQLRLAYLRGQDPVTHLQNLEPLAERTRVLASMAAEITNQLLSDDSSSTRYTLEARAVMLASGSLLRAVRAYQVSLLAPDSKELWDSVGDAHATLASVLLEMSAQLYQFQP